MKAVCSKIFPYAFVLVIAGLLSACSGTASSRNGTGDSGYPKLASAVATAEIKGLDGSKFTLNDKTGKVMLVNLWATWCGPCRSEITAHVKMQESLGQPGLEVLGRNTDDEDVRLINDFAAELKVNYPIAYADTTLQANFLKISKFPGIPQSFLIDRDGRLRGVFRGANPAEIRKMEEVVRKVVNEDPTQ